jgi:hypothetical protein
MNRRELELFYLNEALRARLPQQVSESNRNSKPSANQSRVALSEALRPGAKGYVDAEGNLHLGVAEVDASKAATAEHEAAVAVFESLGMSKAAATAAARGREVRY